MHGIDGQQSLLEPELAQQSLDRRDFVGLFIAVEMRQQQGRARCKRAENMRGLTVLEGVEALPQCLAVHGDVPLARRSRLLVKDGSMAPERLLDRSGVELPENVPDGRIGWRPTPFQPEELAETNEMDVDETMDTPVRVGSGDHRQNGEQNHMRQTIQLAFSRRGSSISA